MNLKISNNGPVRTFQDGYDRDYHWRQKTASEALYNAKKHTKMRTLKPYVPKDKNGYVVIN